MKRMISTVTLSTIEARAILRAADDLIGQGGRTLLAKILKGSKDQKLLKLELNDNPAYGFYNSLTLDQIMAKVDQAIDEGFLRTEKSGDLPMLVFTPFGWAIERERRAEEFKQEWDRWLENGTPPISMAYLRERNRGLVFLFLYKLACSENKKYIPYLELYERSAFRKVQAEIRNVIQALEKRGQLEDSAWEDLKRELARTLLIRSEEPVVLGCPGCNGIIFVDETDPDAYASEGLRIPELCVSCEDKASRRKRR